MTNDPALSIACNLARRFEGCVLHPYQDSTGVWTIGYGATWLMDGSRVTADTPPITQAEADALIEHQMDHFIKSVDGMVIAPTNPNQTAALGDFSFNLGVEALRGSTLLRLLNAGNYVEAAHQFRLWVHAGGEVLPGLVKRRAAEAALFRTPWRDTVKA